ncbi:4,5-DOPA dioxygenase extradiol [Novosphingobium sp. B 225]|uniref:4,5-DOPA-extradiol-dioxygenase n=1 Tax=Novosphingobium sp. B 225 TaxID=1961849 RepID=UPI000B4AE003|nr:4,5-DOPA dioxygenase extradiol [Novosphingobium sp. B 225]
MTQARMPALFLGHGSPMTVISDVPERRAWQRLGQLLPRPTAILVVSAHWETQGKTHVTTGPILRTIHDFRGFPPELFAMQYPAPGSDDLAARIERLLGSDRIQRDDTWGFDHGAWGVVQPMYPEADIPMVEMSLDRTLDAEAHVALGKALAPLRDEGVLLIASGNVIHNLALWRQLAGTQPDWALEFRERVNRAMIENDHAALTRFAPDDRAAGAAINSAEHYLPLLYTLGARLPGDEVGVFNDTLDGALSMTSYLLGDTALLTELA